MSRADGLCSRCGEVRDGKHGSYCKACNAEYRREWREKHPGRDQANQRAWNKANPDKQPVYKRRYTIKQYGISPDQFEAMIVEQGGVCACCGEEPNEFRGKTKFVIDHDHTTGRVRSLLCSRCNCAIGLIDENPDKASALAEYLRAHQRPELREVK